MDIKHMIFTLLDLAVISTIGMLILLAFWYLCCGLIWIFEKIVERKRKRNKS